MHHSLPFLCCCLCSCRRWCCWTRCSTRARSRCLHGRFARTTCSILGACTGGWGHAAGGGGLRLKVTVYMISGWRCAFHMLYQCRFPLHHAMRLCPALPCLAMDAVQVFPRLSPLARPQHRQDAQGKPAKLGAALVAPVAPRSAAPSAPAAPDTCPFVCLGTCAAHHNKPNHHQQRRSLLCCDGCRRLALTATLFGTCSGAATS